jgi:UrcA family protein
MLTKLALASLATLAAVGIATASHAGQATNAASDPATTSVSISVADLNLSDPAGAHTALRRIQSAAEAVCGEKPDIRLMQPLSVYRACLTTSVRKAVGSLDAPLVTAMFDGHPAVMVADRH